MNTKTILILAANPADTTPLRLDKEVREIQAGLQRASRREHFALQQQWAARPVDIRRAMLDYHPAILHFCGHGEGEAGLAFENDQGKTMLVSTEALAGFAKLFSGHVECVLLNACYSEVQAEAMARHIPYVIGMDRAVSDQAAVEFAVAFYDALGAGQSYEFAYQLGCNAIQMAGIPEHLTPVLKQCKQAPVETASATESFGGFTVFLAEVSDDLQGERQQMRAHLEQFNVRVVPEQMYYFPEPAKLEQTIDEELRQSTLFVQLLSAANPMRPPGMSTPRLQYERAVQSGLPILQWRSPSLDLAAVSDDMQRALLETPGIVAAPLEEFKQHVTRRLQRKVDEQRQAEKRKLAQQLEQIEQPASGDTLVFINAAPQDNETAERIGVVLEEQGVGYCLPLGGDLSPAERRHDLEENLLDCDAVIVLYDLGSVVWVREQLRYCRRVSGKRDKPLKVIAVFHRAEQKASLGMSLPNLRMLEFNAPNDGVTLPKFLEALRQTRASASGEKP
ncbi:MAG: CHAT domain-containing protein [Gammaproteobacteria bacterium]|nr:CHAT domain-containing protein [Gammaproteobacteria bacterium]